MPTLDTSPRAMLPGSTTPDEAPTLIARHMLRVNAILLATKSGHMLTAMRPPGQGLPFDEPFLAVDDLQFPSEMGPHKDSPGAWAIDILLAILPGRATHAPPPPVGVFGPPAFNPGIFMGYQASGCAYLGPRPHDSPDADMERAHWKAVAQALDEKSALDASIHSPSSINGLAGGAPRL